MFTGLLVALAIAAMIGFTYRTLVVRQSLNQRMIERSAEYQATTLGIYLEERRKDVAQIAGSPIVTAYAKNKALGMSLEYGLGATLVNIVTLFQEDLLNTSWPHFRRIVFYDSGGTVLADAGVQGHAYTFSPETSQTTPLPRHAGIWACPRNVEGPVAEIIAVCPVRYKGDLVGYLAGFVNSPLRDDGVLRLQEQDTAMAIMLKGKLVCYRGRPDSLKHIDCMASRPTTTGMADWNGFLCTMSGGREPVCLAVPIEATPFHFVMVLPTDPALWGLSPICATAILTAITLVLVALLVFAIRGAIRNSALKARLQSEHEVMECISGKNVSLEAEIRQRREIEEQLRRATREAEVANSAKSEFLANMSHELRTPLSAILGYTDILEETLPSEAMHQECALIRRNGEHLLGLINGILDLSKIEAGKMQVEILACEPREILDDVVAMMGPVAQDKGLALRLDCDPALPASICTDPTRLRQILINLIGNAIKFTAVGQIRVVARRSQERAGLEIAVQDTGVGMTAEQLERLFQPFVQADSSTTRIFGGTGLGLHLSRSLAELLGGTLDASSRLQEGSTFTLRLPLRTPMPSALVGPACEAKSSPTRPDWAPSADVMRLQGCRILLAEDGPDNQRILGHFLTKDGAKVAFADNGQEALRLANEARRAADPFDLILMDIQMPVLDGYEATRQLRQAGYELPIIALTANAMIGDRDKSLQAGCTDYLTKPVTRTQLLETVLFHWTQCQSSTLSGPSKAG